MAREKSTAGTRTVPCNYCSTEVETERDIPASICSTCIHEKAAEAGF